MFSVNEKLLFDRLALRMLFTRQCKPKRNLNLNFVNFRL